MADAQILAYLRAVGKARLDTIAHRVRQSPEKLSGRLYTLIEAEAVAASDNTFSLSPTWRQILPEIITIEIKVANWQRTVEQAARNRIFAHVSFLSRCRRKCRCAYGMSRFLASSESSNFCRGEQNRNCRQKTTP